jgi:hypothetical protein
VGMQGPDQFIEAASGMSDGVESRQGGISDQDFRLQNSDNRSNQLKRLEILKSDINNLKFLLVGQLLQSRHYILVLLWKYSS